MFSSAGFQEGSSLHERDYHSPALSKQEGDVGVPSTAESSSTPLPTISLRDISADAFGKVIGYLYSDQIQQLNLPLIFEVLEAATRFLLPGLRAICGAILIEESHQVDVFDLYSIARMYDLPRLENHCFYLFARDLDVVRTEEFGQLVRESAMTIQSREDIDSIPFLDEIRFHVSQCHKWDQEELERKYRLVDELLDKLELGA